MGKTETLLNSMRPQAQIVQPIGTELILPNHSGIKSHNETVTFLNNNYLQLANSPPQFISQRYYTGCPVSPNAATSLVIGTVNYCQPFWVGKTRTFDSAAINVTNLTAPANGDSVVICIYNADATTGLPSTLLVNLGQLVLSSTGVKELAISQTLTSGFYWLVAAGYFDASSGTLSGHGTISWGVLGESSSLNGISSRTLTIPYVSFPPPSTFAGQTPTYTTNAFVVRLRAL